MITFIFKFIEKPNDDTTITTARTVRVADNEAIKPYVEKAIVWSSFETDDFRSVTIETEEGKPIAAIMGDMVMQIV